MGSSVTLPPMSEFRPNTLYYGDNLDVLRDFPSECVDLVYLDPPFNSARSYNVLFKEAKGVESEAQIEAFGDTWQWSIQVQRTYEEVASRGDDVGRLLEAFVSALGHNDVTAYLTMMAPRLVELRRVLKPTGSNLPPLRPHRQPLLEGVDGCGVRRAQLPVGGHLEAKQRS